MARVFSFSKVAVLIGILLVFVGYRWGKRKAQERTQAPVAPRPAAPPPAAPGWLSVKLLLGVVIVLLIIAIFTSLQR